jgi:2'-5' RNA ligase
MRAFVAIPIPDATRQTLMSVQAALPAGRALSAENLHLTLAFLGEISDRQTEMVHDALAMIRCPCFPVSLRGFGAFGGARPRVIYAGVAPSESLQALHRRVRSRLHGAGLMLQRERFVPHVTLARLGYAPAADDVARLARFIAAEGERVLEGFSAESFALFRSYLAPDGAVHEELARYHLEGAAQIQGEWD